MILEEISWTQIIIPTRKPASFLCERSLIWKNFNFPDQTLPLPSPPSAKLLDISYQLHFSDQRPRVGILVSIHNHCLVNVLQRQRRGELGIDIPLILSNHDTTKWWADLFDIPFCHCPVQPGEKPKLEQHLLQGLKQAQVSLVILARYMQIVSEEFLQEVGCPVINIHHSFLPAFMGGKPYHQAHKKGVKIIGATAHYATVDVDEGPIIEQAVVRVGHRDTIEDMIRKGRDVEIMVLAPALRYHIEHRVLVYGQKTVVFD